MEQAFIDILKQLVKEQGSAALMDTKRCRTFLSDYTRNEYKKESRLLIQAVEAEVPKAIEGAEDLAFCKKGKIRDLEEEYGLSPIVATEIVNTLALVLRRDTSKGEIAKPVIEKAPAPQKPSSTSVSNSGDFGINGSSSAPKQQSTSTPALPPVSSLPSNFTGIAGEHIFLNGDIYKGEWNYGKPCGNGKIIYKNGDVYEGDFYAGIPEGIGKKTYQDGRVYEGKVFNYGPDGKGKMIYPDGKVEEGKWKDGQFKGKGLFG